jgi:NAD(P)-dependent dehydrogenase (short-subunit alcohol dehydrogenase family)
LARQLCAAGHTVYGVARREEKLRELETAFPQTFRAFPGDVTNKEQVSRLCDNLPELPDVAILNAGLGDFDPRGRIDLALHERSFAVNYFGALHFITALFDRFRARGRGKFVATSSLAGYRGLPGGAAYCASKAAISVAMEAFRLSYGRTGVEFVAVHPGFVKTDMTAKNPNKLLFLWPVEKAAAYIIAGIESGKLNINFPWPMRLMTGVGWLLPPGLYRRVMGGKVKIPK